MRKTYGDAVCVFLSDSLSFSLALLKRVLVLELGSHDDDVLVCDFCLNCLGNIDSARSGDGVWKCSGEENDGRGLVMDGQERRENRLGPLRVSKTSLIRTWTSILRPPRGICPGMTRLVVRALWA